MKGIYRISLALLAALIVTAPGFGQQPATDAACSAAPCGAAHGCGCPDDYCPHPYPPQCWPPYLPFYRCAPAGDCGPAACCGPKNDRLTWWFLPTPRALREALWCQP